MDGARSDLPAVAGLPAQRPPEGASSADVLRSVGLDALVALLERSAQGFGVTGEGGRWVYLNPAGCRLLGRSFAELRGTDAAPHCTPAGPVLQVGGRELTPVVLATPSPHSKDGRCTDEAARREAARSAATQERLRLGRDLHDSVSSALFALHTRTQVVDRALAAGDLALLAEAAKDMQALSGQAIAELRAMVSAMREDQPAADGGPGSDLPGALQRLAGTVRRRDGLQVQLRLAPALPAVPPATAEHLALLAAEAVHNCLKHAGTSEVRVELEVRGSELVLTVADDGRGFDGSVAGGGHGQRTMRERAVLCGGWLHVDTGPGRGTRVVARVPLPG